MDDLEIVVSLIVGLATLLGFVTGFFKKSFAWLRRAITGAATAPPIPKHTLVAVPTQHPCSFWWHMGRSGYHSAMQIVGDVIVTNITDQNLLLTGVRLKRPRARGHIIVKGIDSNFHGEFYIPPRLSTTARFDFSVMPPVRREGEALVSDVGFVDQFGNVHWLKKVEFRYT